MDTEKHDAQHRSSADHALPSLSVPAAVAQHTPGPWRVDPDYPRDIQANGLEVAVLLRAAGDSLTIKGPCAGEDVAEANAARIVACVNFCEGLPNSAMDGKSVMRLVEAHAELLALRDEARAFLAARSAKP